MRSLAGVFVLALTISLVPTASAAQDRLSRPAMMSTLAEHSLLLDVSRAGDLLLAVGERGHILRSEDLGQSWEQVPVPVSVTLTTVFLVDEQFGWAAGHDGALLATQDGGRSWAVQLDGYHINDLLVAHYQGLLAQLEAGEREDLDPNLVALALDDAQFARDDGPTKPFLDLYFTDRRHGWAVGAYGLFLKTADGGTSWQPAMLALDNPDSFHLNAIAASGEHLLIAGEAGVLFRADLQGTSWQRLDAGYEGPLFSATALDGSRWLLGGLRGRLFLSTDGGESWEAIATSTRSTLNAATRLSDGRLVAIGNGGALLLGTPDATDYEVRMLPGRVSYTALVEASPGELVMVGQKGVKRTSLATLMEMRDE